jgi:fucose permease
MPQVSRPANYRILLIAYLGFIVIGIPGGTLNIAWRYIQADLNLTFSALGTLLITTSVGGLFVSFYSGSIISRMGIGRFLLAGCVLCLTGYTGFVSASSWTVLILSGILLGFGTSSLINAFNTFVATNFRSSHMNWLHASFGIGSTIGPLIVTLLVIDSNRPWQSAYILIIAAFMTLIILILLTRNHWTVPDATQQQSKADTQVVPLHATLRLPAVWLAIGIFFFATGTEISTSQLTNTLFVDGRGYDAKIVGTWISTFWLCFTASRTLTGFFIDRVDYRIFLRLCMAGTMLGGMLIAVNIAPPVSFAGLLLMGITLAPIAPTLFSNIPQQMGMNHALNAMGFINAGAGLGLAFPPALASRMSELVGLEFIPPFLVIMTIITLGLHEWLLYRQNQKRGYNVDTRV